MTKTLKKSIAFILMVCTFSASIFSCSLKGPDDEVKDGEHDYHPLFPEGYTGGFHHQPGAGVEYWWAETSEEALEAIELLKSHGSTFFGNETVLFDSDVFDVKYCFIISRGDKIKFGDNPFDRYARDVYITRYIFFEPVTIDEINHSLVSRYNAYDFQLIAGYSAYLNELTSENIEIKEWKKYFSHYDKEVYYGDMWMINIRTAFYVDGEDSVTFNLTDEHIKSIISNWEVVKLNE